LSANSPNQAAVVAPNRGPSEVAHEGLIAEKSQFAISKLSTRIWIVADEAPTWSWYISCLGKVQWMVSKDDLPSRTKDDSPWFSKESEEASELSPVDILLVQGRWPDASDCI
jgi:hypothetical protein